MTAGQKPADSSPGQALGLPRLILVTATDNMNSTESESVLFLEPTSGISGDMFLGSLMDLSEEQSWLVDSIETVLPEGTAVETWEETRSGITGRRFRVEREEESTHRHLEEVASLINRSDLPEAVKNKSVELFNLLAEVEATIHGSTKSEVHFHEVGAIDSIADIVGAATAIWKLDPDTVHSGPVNLGEGTISTTHGELPVPAPATAELLRKAGAPTYSSGTRAELTTPTGALILASFVDEYGRPEMKFEKIGYGLGSRELEGEGNFLRATLGTKETPRTGDSDRSLVLETNLDDMNPELFSVVERKLLEAGAHDVYKEAVQMKKNRPGVKLTVIADPADERKLEEIIFRNTTTLGIRKQQVERTRLERTFETVHTEDGKVDIKVGYLEGSPVNYSPEFEDCRKLAENSSLTTKEIYRKAVAAAEKELEEG